MNTAAQVSVGSPDLVLENGPDVMNSDDEDAVNEEHGDVLTDMYTAGLKAPVLLSQSEVARQRAAAEHFKKVGYGNWINSDAQTSTSSDFSQSAPTSPATTRCGSRFETSGRSNPFKSAAPPRPSTPVAKASPVLPMKTSKSSQVPSGSLTSVSVPPDPPSPERSGRSGKKASAPRAPAESDGSHPMVTRHRASRARDLRPVGGPGQTDTCVASSHPSQT
jgi:hypothetical protein